MLPFQLGAGGEGPLTVLCLGAHSDDIEIGCAGTLLRLVESDREVRFHWVVFCSDEARKAEAHAGARACLGPATEAKIRVMDFRDGFLPAQWGEVKQAFESLKQEVRPDLVFTAHRRDLHQDHRTVSELTWNTFRDHAILEYEIAKFDADLGTPNVFVPLDEAQVRRKCELLQASFPSQHGRSWFDEEAFRALLRIRGVESNAPGGYAEAFHARKLHWRV